MVDGTGAESGVFLEAVGDGLTAFECNCASEVTFQLEWLGEAGHATKDASSVLVPRGDEVRLRECGRGRTSSSLSG